MAVYYFMRPLNPQAPASPLGGHDYQAAFLYIGERALLTGAKRYKVSLHRHYTFVADIFTILRALRLLAQFSEPFACRRTIFLMGPVDHIVQWENDLSFCELKLKSSGRDRWNWPSVCQRKPYLSSLSVCLRSQASSIATTRKQPIALAPLSTLSITVKVIKVI